MQNTLWHKSQHIFFNLSPRIVEIKAKRNKWDLLKLKKHLHSKGNKKQPTDWEKYFSNDVTDKGLVSNISKQLMTLNRIKTTHSKNGQKTARDTSAKRTHRWSTGPAPPAIRETQTKTIIRYDLTPVRMAIIKKSTNNERWRGCGEMGTLLPCWWECKLVQPLWRTVWRFLKTLNIELPYDCAIPLLGIYPEKSIAPKTHTPQCSLWHCLQQTRHGSNLNVCRQEWIKKTWHINTREYYSAIKKNEIRPSEATWMDLECVMLSEVSQRRGNIIWYPLYVESKEKWYRWTYLQNTLFQTKHPLPTT